jgi:hypothetical protein
MPLVYVPTSGAEGDQFDVSTPCGARSVQLQDVSGGGTTLPDGEYSGEPLVWDGAAWVPSNGVAVESIQAVTPGENLSIVQLTNLNIVAAGDVFFRGRAPDPQASTLSMNGGGIVLEARAPGVVRIEQDASLRVRTDATGLGFFDALPVGVQSITGALPQDQIDSIVAALVAFGLATDDR